jgi:soluble lytic murein transglycosylase-like protein
MQGDANNTGKENETPQAVDLDRAVRRNRYWSVKLGWQAQYDAIERLLGFRDYCPNEKTFAEAVAKWQKDKGIEVDGIIGPNTSARLQNASGIRFAPEAGTDAAGVKVKPDVTRRIDEYKEIIDRVSFEEGVDSNVIRGIIAAESGGDKYAGKGKSGYKGLMQAYTHKKKDLKNHGNQFDPEVSIKSGTRKFKLFRDRYLGPRLTEYGIDIKSLDKATQLRWVLAAYNAGHVTVLKAVEYAAKAGEVSAWLKADHYQRALVFSGGYALYESCSKGYSKDEIANARNSRRKWSYKGKGVGWPNWSDPPVLEQLEAEAPKIMMCWVNTKHSNTPGYLNKAVRYMEHYDSLK